MRERRHLVDNAFYHVGASINYQAFALFKDEDKDLFLDYLDRCHKIHDFEVKNLCIMSNHIHFLIRPAKGVSLSKIMQWLLSCFAKAYNRKYGIRGHLFYDRFMSKVISTAEQFIKTMRYITDNPVKAKIVKIAADYKYSGLYFLINNIKGILQLDYEEEKLLLAGLE